MSAGLFRPAYTMTTNSKTGFLQRRGKFNDNVILSED